jgi:hypothetical protein
MIQAHVTRHSNSPMREAHTREAEAVCKRGGASEHGGAAVEEDGVRRSRRGVACAVALEGLRVVGMSLVRREQAVKERVPHTVCGLRGSPALPNGQCCPATMWQGLGCVLAHPCWCMNGLLHTYVHINTLIDYQPPLPATGAHLLVHEGRTHAGLVERGRS